LSDLAELYLVFLVLYLFECLAWVPRRTVGFFAFAGHYWGRTAFRPNTSWSGSVLFGKPWPPLSPPWLAEPLPFALDPQGITRFDLEEAHLAWEELVPISARGNRVESGKLLLATLVSRKGAADLAEALERTRTLPAKKRESALRKFLDTRFDLDAPLARQKVFQKSALVLRVISNALWLSLFGGLCVAVFTQNLLILLCAAAMSLLLWPINSLVFLLTLRKATWLPRVHWPDLSKRLVVMLSPLSGVRGADLLAREVWANLDPMTVAVALFPHRNLTAFARPRLVAMQTRQGDELAWWRTEIRQRMERVLAAKNFNVAAILAPPKRENTYVETYCPCCLAQYESGRKAGEPCPNETCTNISLRPFTNGDEVL
jgi:hypothetical protein